MVCRPLNFRPILSLCAVLVGCGGNPTVPTGELAATTVDVTVRADIDCGTVPSVDPVKMRSISWDWMTVDQITWVALSVDDYKALGNNTSDWLAASKQMRAQRDYYRDCLARTQEIGNENLDVSLVPDISPSGSE